jgi:hypothetical protein
MPFMVFRKVLVQVVRGYELQHGVAEELHPLVGAQGEVREAKRAVGERPGQEADVSECDADGVFKLGEFLNMK